MLLRKPQDFFSRQLQSTSSRRRRRRRRKKGVERARGKRTYFVCPAKRKPAPFSSSSSIPPPPPLFCRLPFSKCNLRPYLKVRSSAIASSNEMFQPCRSCLIGTLLKPELKLPRNACPSSSSSSSTGERT